MSFGKKLKAAREKAGLTVAECCAMYGCAARTWFGWESGEHTPPKLDEVPWSQEQLIAGLQRFVNKEGSK